MTVTKTTITKPDGTTEVSEKTEDGGVVTENRYILDGGNNHTTTYLKRWNDLNITGFITSKIYN